MMSESLDLSPQNVRKHQGRSPNMGLRKEHLLTINPLSFLTTHKTPRYPKNNNNFQEQTI